MPRVSHLSIFIKMYYLESRKMCFGLSEDEARREAVRIWSDMSPSHRSLAKSRLEFAEQELLSPTATSFFQQIEASSDAVLASILDNGVLSEVKKIMIEWSTPIFFLQVHESEYFAGYPEELTIVKYSLAKGAEDYFHALFDVQGLDELELRQAMKKMTSKPRVIPIRDHRQEFENLDALAVAIRNFTGGAKLFTQHRLTRPSHRVIQLVNRVDVDLEQPQHEIFEVDMLVYYFAAMKLTAEEIHQRLEKFDEPAPRHLACDFHRACERPEKCTLLHALRLAHRCAEVLVDMWDGRALFRAPFRPMGRTFSGNGKFVNPLTLCEKKADGVPEESNDEGNELPRAECRTS